MSAVDGQPWEDYRPWPNGPTHRQINEVALVPASQMYDYCLCLHPMAGVINFSGLTCKWCDQPVTDAYASDEAKKIRGAAILAAFPELRRCED